MAASSEGHDVSVAVGDTIARRDQGSIQPQTDVGIVDHVSGEQAASSCHADTGKTVGNSRLYHSLGGLRSRFFSLRRRLFRRRRSFAARVGLVLRRCLGFLAA